MAEAEGLRFEAAGDLAGRAAAHRARLQRGARRGADGDGAVGLGQVDAAGRDHRHARPGLWHDGAHPPRRARPDRAADRGAAGRDPVSGRIPLSAPVGRGQPRLRPRAGGPGPRRAPRPRRGGAGRGGARGLRRPRPGHALGRSARPGGAATDAAVGAARAPARRGVLQARHRAARAGAGAGVRHRAPRALPVLQVTHDPRNYRVEARRRISAASGRSRRDSPTSN